MKRNENLTAHKRILLDGYIIVNQIFIFFILDQNHGLMPLYKY